MQINNTGNFIPGSFVEVYLKTVTNQQAVTVPNTALLEEQGVFFVWVQVTPELFEKREVHIGKTDGIDTEIKSGIGTTERIVARGAMMIKLAQATGSLDAHSGHVH
jgi:multidrug efflux pump subunit AcrA (membrane-fusion protein)